MPSGWDETLLSELEREAMRHIGPVGKVLVRRAARGETELSVVRDTTAASIVDPEARERFLDATARLVGHMPIAARPATGFAQTRIDPGRHGTPLQPEDVDRVSAALAPLLGPISRPLARQCSARSTTREELVAQVLGQLTGGIDAKKVEHALWTVFK